MIYPLISSIDSLFLLESLIILTTMLTLVSFVTIWSNGINNPLTCWARTIGPKCKTKLILVGPFISHCSPTNVDLARVLQREMELVNLNMGILEQKIIKFLQSWSVGIVFSDWRSCWVLCNVHCQFQRILRLIWSKPFEEIYKLNVSNSYFIEICENFVM